MKYDYCRKNILFLVLTITFLLTACGQRGSQQKTQESMNSICPEEYDEIYDYGVEFGQETYSDENWREPGPGTYSGDVVNDQYTALAIATDVFANIDKSETAEKMTPRSVMYDPEEKVWHVHFLIVEEDQGTGNDCSIAIDQHDGRIIKIQFGE